MATRQNDEEEDTTFLEIDELNLELEWQKQPILAEKWLKKLAKARRVLDSAKAEQELVEAQLDQKIREDPDAFDIVKPTENAIATAIILQDEYQKAVKAVNRAKYEASLIEATCTAIDHRKRALEGMVDLFGQQYWSLPSSKSENGKEAIHEMRKKAARTKTKRREADDE